MALSSGGVGSSGNNTAAAEAARRRAAEQAAERARQAAIAAQKAAQAAQKKAEESAAKLKDALQKPDAKPEDVAKLRDQANTDRQAAITAGQAAQQKDATAISAEKKADTIEQQDGIAASNRKYASVANLGDNVDLSKLSATQSAQLLGGTVPTNVLAANDAKFVSAATANGNGAQALSTALANHPNDPEYAKQLVQQTKGPLEDSIRSQLKSNPEDGAKSLQTYLNALPADARPAVVDSFKADAANAIQAKASTDPQGAADMLSKLVDAAPDAASKKALVDASQGAITAIGKKLDDDNRQQAIGQQPLNDQSMQKTMDSLAHVGATSGPDGMKAVTDAFAKGITNKDTFTPPTNNPNAANNAINELMQKNPDEGLPFASELSKSLGANNATASRELGKQVETEAVAHLDKVKGQYEDAKSKVEDDNKKLSTELQRIGPGLTEEQKKQFVEQFRKDHAEDYKAEEEATKKLAETLKSTTPLISQSTDPHTAQVAVSAAKDLAGTNEGAQAAKDFAVNLAKNPDSPMYKALDQVGGKGYADDQLNDVVSKAVPNLYANALKESGGDTEKAGEKLKEQLEGIESLKTFASSAEPIKRGIEALTTGKLDELKDIGEGNAFGHAFKVAGVMLGVAKAANGDESVQAYVQNLAATGKEGAEIVAEGTEKLAKTLPEGAISSGLEGVSSFAKKLAPGLGLVANALATSQDFQQLRKDGNAGDAIKLLGDAMSTVGSALAVTGVGEVVAVPLEVVGGFVSAIGGAISSKIKEGELKDEEKKVLNEMGLGNLAGPLSDADPEALKNTADSLGMSPEQMQKLVVNHSDIFGAPGYAQGFIDAAKANGIKGDDVNTLADALQKDNPNFVSDLFTQLDGKDGIHNSVHDDQLRNLLQSGQYPTAGQFVKSKSPDLFGGSAASKQQADRDFENRSGSDPWVDVSNMMKRNHDPAYQAELINRMKQDGSLQVWAQQMGTNYNYNGWPQAAQEAIRNAQQAGVLSPGDAQKYLQQTGG